MGQHGVYVFRVNNITDTMLLQSASTSYLNTEQHFKSTRMQGTTLTY
jgi:hypothetical protein